MAKYENKTARVYIVGGKDIIPGSEPVELSDAELANTKVQEYIKAGYLVKVAETIAIEPTTEIPAEPPAETPDTKPKK